MDSQIEIPIEEHPFEPFVPAGARVLIMGTFPPQPKRWDMKFYYPNRTNDFWKIMGLIFLDNPLALYDKDTRHYRLQEIIELMTEKHIALSDTGAAVRRLAGNASDKFLEIVKPVNLDGLLDQMPECKALVTTGEKAAGVLAELTGTEAPQIGCHVPGPRNTTIWRMPSTSRAYPLALDKKAEYYAAMFHSIGII